MSFFEAVTYGFLIGVSTALSPGPFIALILAEALDGKIKNALVISLTPIITDIPIMFLSFSVIKNILTNKYFLSLISFLGGTALIFYGISHIRIKRFSYVRETGKVEEPDELIASLWKGITVNILSPYTYIFWFFVATGFLAGADVISFIWFVISFFVGLMGSSILVAYLVYKGRTFLTSKFLVNVTRLLGIILLLFGVRLIYEGLKLFS